MNSDNNFVLLRRFGCLRARILLYKQDELIELENRMNSLDFAEKTSFYLSSRKEDRNFARKKLLLEIDQKMTDYGNDGPSICCRMIMF